MSNYSLPDSEISELREAHSATKVAEALLIDRNTIRTYFRKYQKGGLEKLLETQHSGSTGFLSVSEAKELDAYLQENLHLTAKSVAAYISRRWKSTIANAV